MYIYTLCMWSKWHSLLPLSPCELLGYVSLCPSSPAGWGRFLPLPDPGCVLWREFLPPTFAKSSLSVDDVIVWLLFDHLYLEFKYLRLLLLWSRGYSNEVELVVQLLKSLTKNRLDFTQQTPFTQSFTYTAVHTYSTHIVFFKLTHNHTHTNGGIWSNLMFRISPKDS